MGIGGSMWIVHYRYQSYSDTLSYPTTNTFTHTLSPPQSPSHTFPHPHSLTHTLSLPLTPPPHPPLSQAVCVDRESEPISLLGLIRSIYKYPEKFASRCDRVLTGNTAPIVSISLMEASKLLVAIDLRGCVCVWDPCSHRGSLTVRYPPPPLASIIWYIPSLT